MRPSHEDFGVVLQTYGELRTLYENLNIFSERYPQARSTADRVMGSIIKDSMFMQSAMLHAHANPDMYDECSIDVELSSAQVTFAAMVIDVASDSLDQTEKVRAELFHRALIATASQRHTT